MAVQEPKKTLRIGVFRGKNRLDERSLDKRRTVSIGQDEANTICILSSAVPKKWNLFVYDSAKDTYSLCIDPNKMHGRILVKPGHEVKLGDSLNESKDVRIAGEQAYISLTNQSRGRIVIGKIAILFEFKVALDKMAAARLLYEPPSFFSKLGEFIPRVLAYGLIISLLAHILPLIYIGVQDWPRDDEIILMPSVFKVVTIDDMILDEDKPPEELDEPELLENSEEIADAPEAPSEDDMGGATKEELMDKITDKHREQGAQITAQILGVDGGVDGFFADMLGANAHIADMSDIAAGDIGASAGGNLLSALAAGEGGNSGSGLLGLDTGGTKNGPQVVVDNKAKTTTTRAKAEFKMTEKSDFATAPPPGSKEAIEKMFARKKGDVTSCYQRVMNAQGKASGRFVISILVQKDGSVQKVEKIEDQIGGEMFTCIRQRIMNWNFGNLDKPIAFKKTWVFS